MSVVGRPRSFGVDPAILRNPFYNSRARFGYRKIIHTVIYVNSTGVLGWTPSPGQMPVSPGRGRLAFRSRRAALAPHRRQEFANPRRERQRQITTRRGGLQLKRFGLFGSLRLLPARQITLILLLSQAPVAEPLTKWCGVRHGEAPPADVPEQRLGRGFAHLDASSGPLTT